MNIKNFEIKEAEILIDKEVKTLILKVKIESFDLSFCTDITPEIDIYKLLQLLELKFFTSVSRNELSIEIFLNKNSKFFS
jgi:hypothetical protein